MKMNIRMLRKIQKNILAEPLRLVMDQWANNRDYIAPCNTAACIAGHALALNTMEKHKVGWQAAGALVARSAKRLENTIARRAGELLGLDADQAGRLFYTARWPEKFKTQYDPDYLGYVYSLSLSDAVSPAGRRRQARVAVKRIEHFIKTKGEE